MQLTLDQVAQLFGVSENIVARWIRQENMPTRKANSQYRFDRAELLEWAAINHHPLSSEFCQVINGEPVGEQSLVDALERGGVATRVPGGDRYQVFRNALAGLPENLGPDADLLLELLIAREKTGGTSIGGGISIPHPSYPVIMPGKKSVIRVCCLAEPLPLDASDGRPIETLFLMICDTVHAHLQLLGKLACILRSDDLRTLLASRPDKTRLLSAVRAAEDALSPTGGVN